MRRVDAWLLAVIAAAGLIYALTIPNVLTRLNPLTGDEPYYVMTAISLLRDRDLNEANNYANRDYLEFYPADPLPAGWRGWPAFPRVLPPHPAQSKLPGLHTKHGLGLSLLIAFPYALAGRVGALLVIVAFAVTLAGQMYLLARETRAPPPLAVLVALGLAVAMPVGPYATLIFPEVPAALLLLYAVRRLSAPADSNVLSQCVATGAAIGFLPWLHQRFGPTAFVLAAVMLIRWTGRLPWPRLAAGLAPVGVGGLGIVLYNIWLYGQPTQSTADHAGFSGPAGTLNGAFGLLLDAQWGAFVAAPVLLLAVAALPWWFRTAPRAATIAALAAAPYLVVIAVYRVWWGEWGPPARYLAPLVPLAAGPLASWLARASLGGRALAAAAWLVGMALTLVGYANPQRFYHQPDGRNNLVAWVGNVANIDLAGRLVAFQPYAVAPRDERVAAGVLIVALLGVATLFISVIPALNAGRADPANRVD